MFDLPENTDVTEALKGKNAMLEFLCRLCYTRRGKVFLLDDSLVNSLYARGAGYHTVENSFTDGLKMCHLNELINFLKK